MVVHEAEVVIIERERYHRRLAIAALLAGAGALIGALAVLLYVSWLLLAPLVATPFDADGVRCYHRAVQVACLKTAEPPR